MKTRSCAPIAASWLCAFLLAPLSVAASVEFAADKLLVDLRQAPWECLAKDAQWTTKVGFGRSDADMKKDAERAKTECEAVSREEGWKPIRVGCRWEPLGHPELNDKITWLRLRFRVPAELKGYRLGFFCTAVDDAADFYLNGTHLARHMYRWGARVPEPVNVDLTPQVRFGADNVLMVRVNDSAQARGGGVLGHVLLYRTLPFERTARGGFGVPALAGSGERSTVQTQPAKAGTPNLSVVLHLGDALLARDEKTAFTAAELRAIEVPPYILRDDELVLVFPAAVAKAAGPHRVQLDEVCPTRDERPLAVRCDKLPARAERFELLTIPVELAASYDNAFDPRQVNVQVVVETPSGRTEKVPAF
ncbi:MAG: hypothetical protein FJ388_25630, partial [Verrucomicrobia bacterium]|nr:hypothetical protein [Verrucomicrobiota bacterium]